MIHRSFVALLLAGAATFAVPVLAADKAQAAQAEMAFNIPASDLATALDEVGRQAKIEISFPYAPIAGRRTAPLNDTLTPIEAVRRLIAGSGLIVRDANAGHIQLVQASSEADQAAGEGPAIVVTGSRLANRRALASKRDSNQIIDAVSQDEVSQLPDVNIVEAARRITGISVISDRDSSRGHDNYQ
jgi:hypothetical protein